jgi:Kdo2-lipid IVA lauroyltransferase/acyltransferase
MRKRFEFILVWTLVKIVGSLPRPVARGIGAGMGRAAFFLLPRLRRTGYRNLALAFPETTLNERQQILRRLYRNLGWLLAEFCKMPTYTPCSALSFVRYEAPGSCPVSTIRSWVIP